METGEIVFIFFYIFPAIFEASQPDQMTWKIPGMSKYTFLLWCVWLGGLISEPPTSEKWIKKYVRQTLSPLLKGGGGNPLTPDPWPPGQNW